MYVCMYVWYVYMHISLVDGRRDETICTYYYHAQTPITTLPYPPHPILSTTTTTAQANRRHNQKGTQGKVGRRGVLARRCGAVQYTNGPRCVCAADQ